jgi:uridine kinase
MQDFEHVSAMNTAVLGERVQRLLAGERAPSRRFSFVRGKGEEDARVHPRDEPAHARGGRGKACPGDVSALTPVSIDANHRFPTTTLRLIRRMVRDCHFRRQSPRKTVQRWGSVRRGEQTSISPSTIGEPFHQSLFFLLVLRE